MVPLVPAQCPRRLFRLHVRQRRDVVRAFHHHRRRIASRFSPEFMGLVHSDLGRHLDLHRHPRNFPLALPPLHSLPSPDRDERSENCFAGIGRAPARSRRCGGKGARMRTPSGHKVYAIAAEYSSATELYEAAKRVRDAGFKRWDVFSPFPIHGMDEAMGLGKSWLSAVVLIGGITGLLTAVVLEFGPSWFIYPVIVHGKPFTWATVPAFFPIMFELTVLFAAFSAFFANLIMNGLPRWHHLIFSCDRVARATNDGFFLAIEARDPRFSELETHDLLLETGGVSITHAHAEELKDAAT